MSLFYVIITIFQSHVYFSSRHAKNQVQFLGNYLRPEVEKKSDISTRACFNQYLSIIYQANIGNVLYLLLCWVIKVKIGDFILFTHQNSVKMTLKNYTKDFQISINKTKLALWFKLQFSLLLQFRGNYIEFKKSNCHVRPILASYFITNHL